MIDPTKRFFLITLIAVMLNARPAQAALLASYLDGVTTNSSDLTGFSGITATSLTDMGLSSAVGNDHTDFGAAFSATTADETRDGAFWLGSLVEYYSSSTTPTSADNYFVFTVTADTPGSLSLTNLTFDLYSSVSAPGWKAGGSLDVNWELFASTDGGSFNSLLSGSSDIALTNPDPGDEIDSALSQLNVDLTGISGVTSVEFRLALGGSRDLAGAGARQNDYGNAQIGNIELNGSIIPEPSSALLGVLGSLLLLRRRR